MFNNMKKRVDETVNMNDIETVIGRSTSIKGQVSGDGNLRVDGHIDGGLFVGGDVVIGETGVVLGDIKAANLIVSGSVTGNVTVEGNLSIRESGQLVGDVKVKTLNIDDGGVFKGHSEMAVKAEVKALDVKMAEKKAVKA